MLMCTLYITGPQNPSFGRKSQGYSFWGANGVIDMVFIEPGTTMNSEHYIATLKTLKQQLRRLWKHKNILPQHDNARPHTLQTITEAVEKLDYSAPIHFSSCFIFQTHNFIFSFCLVINPGHSIMRRSVLIVGSHEHDNQLMCFMQGREFLIHVNDNHLLSENCFMNLVHLKRQKDKCINQIETQ